jgi:hypothetical protein
MSYDGAAMRLFVDGQLTSQVPASGSIVNNTSPIWIGAQNGAYWGRVLNGALDEIRISSIPRYTSNFTPLNSPFVTDQHTVALYHFDEGLGNIAHDASGNGNDGLLVNDPEWICSTAPLPVELMSFDAVPTTQGIHLSFSTASELDNDWFEIWRGETRVEQFERIAILPSQGNSSTGHLYVFLDSQVSNGHTYWYYLADVDLSGNRTEHRDMMRTATAGSASVVPVNFSLSAYPNPFNPSTTISFTFPDAESAKLDVCNLSGRIVTQLLNGPVEAGEHRIVFDGSILPTGVYFVRMEATSFRTTERLLLLK